MFPPCPYPPDNWCCNKGVEQSLDHFVPVSLPFPLCVCECVEGGERENEMYHDDKASENLIGQDPNIKTNVQHNELYQTFRIKQNTNGERLPTHRVSLARETAF